uniref:Uncharacterized protein n=1 Tax=Apteryx owenii TaxID=8824 RepID=A0A8B9PAY9_APTOW
TACTSLGSKTVVSKAVPMLTPKPYSQPKNTQQVLKNFKVDGKVSMNGENVNGVEEKDKECTTVIFTPSPSRSLKFDGVARGDRPPVELKKDPTSTELSLQRPAIQSVHKEPTHSAFIPFSEILEKGIKRRKKNWNISQQESRCYKTVIKESR